jgi:two-component sensor histidine kinase
VPSLDDVVREHAAVAEHDQGLTWPRDEPGSGLGLDGVGSESDVAWLRALVAEWHLLSDLSFADLVLWLPMRTAPGADPAGFVAVAQRRPSTGPTAYAADLVGTQSAPGRRPLLDSAFATGRIRREGDPEWYEDVPVRVEAVPVRHEGRVLGVITRNTNLVAVRTPSRLELVYLECASRLTRMIAEGRFPRPVGERTTPAEAPSVGDGLLQLDPDGVVLFASPNATSAFRRAGYAGDLVGQPFGRLARQLAARTAAATAAVEEDLRVVLSGRESRLLELRLAHDAVVLTVRTIPLDPAGVHAGALALVRDVTDVRRREAELLSKEATIREIHHRVKNNLQTVASLLRLQARRVHDPSAAAALEEAVGRVAAIAVVHDTLSRTADELVDFDDVTDRLLALLVDMIATPDGPVPTLRREAHIGHLPADLATPLAMVLTELVQNAVEHGGRDGAVQVWVRGSRTADEVRLAVVDDGPGLPAGFDPTSTDRLGLQIVRTLLDERAGTVRWVTAPGGGTVAEVRLPL